MNNLFREVIQINKSELIKFTRVTPQLLAKCTGKRILTDHDAELCLEKSRIISDMGNSAGKVEQDIFDIVNCIPVIGFVYGVPRIMVGYAIGGNDEQVLHSSVGMARNLGTTVAVGIAALAAPVAIPAIGLGAFVTTAGAASAVGLGSYNKVLDHAEEAGKK